MTCVPLRLLVVEDEPAHVEAIQRVFQTGTSSVRVLVASSLQQFREMISSETPDIALLDLSLPDGRAIDALNSSPQGLDFPVVVMVSYGAEQTAVEAIKAGALEYLVKSPEAFSALPRTIAGALREWELLQEKKRSERALRESEAKYRLLADNISDVLWVLNPVTGERISVSPSVERLRGYTVEEVLAQKPEQALTPESAAYANKVMTERVALFLSGQPGPHSYIDEIEQNCKDGTKVWTEVVTRYVRNERGEPNLLGISRDISKRKHTEEALRASEARNKALLSAIPDLMFLFGRDGIFQDFHALHSHQLMVPSDIFLGRHINDVLPTSLAELTLFHLTELFANGQPRDYFYEAPVGNEIRFFESRMVLCGKESALAIVRDVTQQKRVEIELRESQELYNDVVSSLPIGVYQIRVKPGSDWRSSTTPPFSVEFVSQQFCQLHGFSQEEFAADRNLPLKLIHPDDRGGFVKANESANSSHSTFMWEGRMLLKGKTRWLHFESQPHPMTNGDTRWTGIVYDITDRKKAEEERKQLEQQVQQTQKLESLGVLAGGIAHDFNNILMAVLGYAELAQGEIPAQSPARESLTQIANAARRAAGLCNQMLAYAGKSSFSITQIDLPGLIEELAHFLKTSISKKAVLNLNIQRGLPLINADASQIQQIVLNLVINASEAIGDRSGFINVSTGTTCFETNSMRPPEALENPAPGFYVYLEVTDNGCGMDPETRTRIFEPFFTTKFAGRGLGLAAVLGIVRAHKGGLQVVSNPGQGTSFKIFLPVMIETEIASVAEVSDSQKPDPGTGAILLVDDEESLRTVCQRMLELLGFNVITAVDGKEALKVYQQRSHEIGLVILDLTMPHMDGVETFQQLRLFRPDVRVVLASGYSQEDVLSRFSENGPAGFLQKPYLLSQLRETLARFFQKQTT